MKNLAKFLRLSAMRLFNIFKGKTAKTAGNAVEIIVKKDKKDIDESFSSEMVWIPGGTFNMGSSVIEAGRYRDEGPQHSVTLSGFYMSKYQVTQEQYQRVMGINPSYFTSVVSRENRTPGRLPVERVSWYDTVVFCNKLSLMEGLNPVYSISGSTDPAVWGPVPTNSNETWNAVVFSDSNGYRLPTEAEWEYACRGGTTTAFNNGNDDYNNTILVHAMAWYHYNSGSKTHEVGLKQPNTWGLYDMHGNVWEWCWDWYGSYLNYSQTNPTGPVTGSSRVVRSGCWIVDGQSLRSANRGSNDPSFSYLGFGFRVVRG